MNIVLYLDQIRTRMGGGSIAMWSLVEGLAERGHRVAIAAARPAGERLVRGRLVHRQPRGSMFRDADVVLCSPQIARQEQGRMGPRARVVCFVHSAVDRPWEMAMPADLYVWASRAMLKRAEQGGWKVRQPQIVLWPIIYPSRVATKPGGYVTLINLAPEKGGKLFWEIAARMPDVRFLGVVGGYGSLDYLDRRPPNIELLDYQEDPRNVYGHTKLLLYMKSQEAGEGYLHGVGMTALEAACSGIPTIAYPGPGLRESLDKAGIWVRSFDPDDWVAQIRRALQPSVYQQASARALERSAILQPEQQLDRAEAELEMIATARRAPLVPAALAL